MSNRLAISWTTIIRTTTRAAKVVIIACSSRPARLRTWLSTATTIPIAAILKIRSTSNANPSFVSRSDQQDDQKCSTRQPKGLAHPALPPALFRILLPFFLQMAAGSGDTLYLGLAVIAPKQLAQGIEAGSPTLSQLPPAVYQSGPGPGQPLLIQMLQRLPEILKKQSGLSPCPA